MTGAEVLLLLDEDGEDGELKDVFCPGSDEEFGLPAEEIDMDSNKKVQTLYWLKTCSITLLRSYQEDYGRSTHDKCNKDCMCVPTCTRRPSHAFKNYRYLWNMFNH